MGYGKASSLIEKLESGKEEKWEMIKLKANEGWNQISASLACEISPHQILIFGGQYDGFDGKSSDDVFMFNVKNGEMKRSAPLPSPACFWLRNVSIMGREVAGISLGLDIYLFNLETGKWRIMKWNQWKV